MIEHVLATGEVARALGLSEPQIQQAIRRHPHLAPPMHRGRRRWRRCHVRALAEHFGVESRFTAEVAP